MPDFLSHLDIKLEWAAVWPHIGDELGNRLRQQVLGWNLRAKECWTSSALRDITGVLVELMCHYDDGDEAMAVHACLPVLLDQACDCVCCWVRSQFGGAVYPQGQPTHERT
jgi:hypothetical protein